MRLNNSCKLLTKYKTLIFSKLKKDEQICRLLLSGLAVYELRTSFERCKKTRIPRSAVYRKYCKHYNSAYFLLPNIHFSILLESSQRHDPILIHKGDFTK